MSKHVKPLSIGCQGHVKGECKMGTIGILNLIVYILVSTTDGKTTNHGFFMDNQSCVNAGFDLLKHSKIDVFECVEKGKKDKK